MQKIVKIFLFSLSIMALFFFAGCREKGYIITNETPFTDLSDDHITFTKETDAVFDDANHIIEVFSAFRGRITSPLNQRVICEATAVLDSNSTTRFITVTYDGKNCSGTRNRYGEVVLSMPLSKRWVDVGAVLTVNVKNLIVTRLRDNQKFILNGVHTITNVTGGSLKNLATLGTIVHEIKSNEGMTIDFSNNARRIWYVSKKRIFTSQNGIVISTVGTGVEGSMTGISEWGTTRAGTAFATVINSPLIIRQDCDYRLVGGAVSHNKLIGTLDVTFGLDANGAPTSCPGASAPYYLKLIYTNPSGNSKTFIIPY